VVREGWTVTLISPCHIALHIALWATWAVAILPSGVILMKEAPTAAHLDAVIASVSRPDQIIGERSVALRFPLSIMRRASPVDQLIHATLISAGLKASLRLTISIHIVVDLPSCTDVCCGYTIQTCCV